MGSSQSSPVTEPSNNVVRVTLYYTPLDPRCLEHLEQFLQLRDHYNHFTVFKCVNAFGNLANVPPSVTKVPIYIIQRGSVIATASPDGGVLEHSLGMLVSERGARYE